MASTYGYVVADAIALVIDNTLRKAQEKHSSQKRRLERLKTEKERNIATLNYQAERIRLQERQIRKIEPLERDVDCLRAEAAEQGRRVETITAERDRLQNSIEILIAERGRLRNSVATLTTERGRLQRSVENLTLERDQLRQSAAEARATITQLEQFETEASELRPQVRELEGLLRSRKRKLEEMAVRFQEAEEKRERLLGRFDFVNQKMIEQTEVASEMKLRLQESLSEIESLKAIGTRDDNRVGGNE